MSREDGMTDGTPCGDPEGQAEDIPTTSRREQLLLAELASLHRYVRDLAGRDSHHVDDIVQETLLRAWQLRERLDWQGRPIRMWLFRVARNLLIDDWRKGRAIPVGVFATEFPDHLATPDESAHVVDRCVLVDALRALPPAHRETVVHVHLLDVAGADLAHRLGVPKGTVKSRTHTALRVLRERLGPHEAAA